VTSAPLPRNQHGRERGGRELLRGVFRRFALCAAGGAVLARVLTPAAGASLRGVLTEEAINTPFCPLQEKFHTFVLRGLRNISEAP
jgi:hypothetical protein